MRRPFDQFWLTHDDAADGGVRVLLSERYLKTTVGVVFWVLTASVIFAASFVPAIAPENVEFWRIALGLPSLAMAMLIGWVGIKAPDAWVQPAIDLMMVPALAFHVMLLDIAPGTELVLFNMMVIFIYAGYFVRLPAMIATLTAGSVIAISTCFTEPASDTPYLGSFLVMYLGVAWATALFLHLQTTETERALGEARRRAYTDQLTGLSNLRWLERSVEKRLDPRWSRRTDSTPTLILIDLINFKSANTKHGHAVGDQVLRAIATQLKRVTPAGSVVARIGGDEFAVLLEVEPNSNIEEMKELCRAAVRAALSLLDLSGVKIEAAVGAAIHPEDGRDLSEMLDVADRAMHGEKGAKRHTVPNLERVEHAAGDSPKWQAEQDQSTPKPAKDELTLDVLLGGRSRLLGSRTLYARFSAFLQGYGALLLALSLAAPGAYPDPMFTWWMAVLVGPIIVTTTLLGNAKAHSATHVFYDFASLVLIAAIVAMTGGLESTASPLLILLVASQAWFWQTEQLTLRIVGPVIVALAPLAYSTTAETYTDQIGVLTVFGLALLLVMLILAMYFNRSQLVGLQRRAEQLALLDPLTGLANRRSFSTYVQQLLDSEEVEKFAVVMLDINDFKRVNTEGGHRAGDLVLTSIAGALAGMGRDDDLIARVGGDEFAVVLPGVGVETARVFAGHLVDAVAGTPEAQRTHVTASAGFALSPLHGETLEELMFTADAALMAVKAGGKGEGSVGRIITGL